MKLISKISLLGSSLLTLGIISANGASLLVNGDFESVTPVPNYGNNIGSVVANWTLVAPGGSSNIVNPLGSYNDGPDNAQTGALYLDIADAAGYYSQSFTLATASTVDFGAYFSRRVAAGGGSASIYNAANTTLLFSSPAVSNDLSVTEEVWTLSQGSAVLSAGTYTFRMNIDDSANADSAFATSTPIPEPTVGLLSVVGVLALARRRRQG